ncbi:MAG: carboxymuconolactone decarboxylase family protein [Candidatus Rokubacteria bacterium]|nr:carboxymuconolactone decarboxylase family protein [Candidatus Rokubacteria bacterium]
MAWVRTVSRREAEGDLKAFYQEVRKQLGLVPNVIESTSIRPEFTLAWMRLYSTLMFGPSELTRIQREMIATVVSVANCCHY